MNHSRKNADVANIVNVQIRVLVALMLRDMRSRFFGNGFGFVIAVAWPLVHIIILLIMFSSSGRMAPYGDSLLLFLSIGIIPFIVFSYMSRFIMLSLVMNRPLINFPIVKVLDILFARAILETLGAIIFTTLLCTILWILNVDFMPNDLLQACYAYGAAIMLGFGMGVINAIIGMAFYGWVTGYSLVIIAFYGSSGILFIPDSLPQILRYYLSFNPVLQVIEWMRTAYYNGYHSTVLDKTYVLAWCLCTVAGGLILERLIRGKLLQG